MSLKRDNLQLKNNCNMKKRSIVLLLIPLFTSCDPVSLMDANIENTTARRLSITFVTSEVPPETLVLDPDELVLFQEGMSTTGSFLEPSLAEFDSIYIQGESQEILKVYKPNSAGKNIYDVENYWVFDEPSKRVYKYDYLVTNEDLND